MACNGKPIIIRDKGDGTYGFSEALEVELSALKVDSVSSFDESDITFYNNVCAVGEVCAATFISGTSALNDLFIKQSPGLDPLDPGAQINTLSGQSVTSITVNIGEESKVYNLTGLELVGDFWVRHRQNQIPSLGYQSTGDGSQPYTLFGVNAEFSNSLFNTCYVTSLDTSVITATPFDSTSAATGLVPNKGYVDISVPVGGIMLWSVTGEDSPTGWLYCDSTNYNFTANPAYEPLFNVVSNTFGNGAGAPGGFNVPDLDACAVGPTKYIIKYWNGKEA